MILTNPFHTLLSTRWISAMYSTWCATPLCRETWPAGHSRHYVYNCPEGPEMLLMFKLSQNLVSWFSGKLL